MEYQDGNSSLNYYPQPEEQYQEACYQRADHVFGGYQPRGFFYDEFRNIYLDPFTGVIYQPGPYGIVANGMTYHNGVFYDSLRNILSDDQVLAITNPHYVPAPQYQHPQERTKITVTRPTQKAIADVSAINAPSVAMSESLLNMASSTSSSSSSTSSSSTPSPSWEADVVDVSGSSSPTNAVSFGVMSYEGLRNKCAQCLAVFLGKEVESIHVILSSDRSSVCNVFYDRANYIVDTFDGAVYKELPEDFDLVGRAVLARDAIKLSEDGKGLSLAGKIIVSHVLNARDENFTLNDTFLNDRCHLGSFHYHKEKGSGIVPEGKSYSVRGSIVDLNVGVVICGSYGWTPVSVQSRIAPKKDGSFVIRSNIEKTIVDNVFSSAEINATPSGKGVDPRGAVTISPFIEGALVRVYLSYGQMFVSSHSKIDIVKSKYRDVFLFELFAQYGLTKEALFPGNYLHSNFHYSFIIRDKALVSSSRFMIGDGSLAYLGVMYNYNSDKGYCPYKVKTVTSTPVKIEEMTRIGSTPITTDPRPLIGSPHIFIPRPFKTLQDANNHLEREFGSVGGECEGSIIVMQKDALGLYTNIVRVMHSRAETRMRFIEGQNDTEAFLKHLPDLDLSNDNFRGKYPLYPINIAALARTSEYSSFEEFVRLLRVNVGGMYLTSENILAYFRKQKEELKDKSKGNYDINAVPSKTMRLRIIALTFVTCLPPSRQRDGTLFYTNYIRFLEEANDEFNRNRSFITSESKEVVKTDKFGKKRTTRGPLRELNERLEFLERGIKRKEQKSAKGKKPVKTGKVVKGKKNEKKPAPSGVWVNFSTLSVEDLILYYRLYNKLLKRIKFVAEHVTNDEMI